MLRIGLKHVKEFRDRDRKMRRYLLRPGQSAIRLPGNPGSPEFIEYYHAALAQMPVREVGKNRSVPGTVSAAIGAYYTSGKFQGLAPNTGKIQRSALACFRANHVHRVPH
jgi:hypothetical protein